MFFKHSIFTFFCSLFLTVLPLVLNAQSPDKPYNRFRFHKYNWQVLHTSAFHIYFPSGYDSLCAFAARELPVAMELAKKRMLVSLDKEPNLIIYPAADQLYESNIGSFEPRSYTLPTVVLKGNRLLVAYNGSYRQLQEDIREAVVRAIWEEQFKADLAAQLKAVVVDEKIPAWFSEGCIRYFAQGWTVQEEDALRRLLAQYEFSSWQEVAAFQGELAGAAFCYYLSRQYYRQSVVQLFFQMRKKKSLRRAIRLITKQPLDSVYNNCLEFYRTRFTSLSKGDSLKASVIALSHPEGRITDLRISPGNDYCLYTVSMFHRRTVYVQSFTTAKRTKILTYRLPPWISDHSRDSYPLTAWQEDGNNILAALPEKGRLRIKAFTTNGQELQENILYGVDGILSMESYDRQNLLMSAFRKGQSDIVSYDLRREKYNAFTDDSYDDNHPAVNASSREIVFVSERDIKTAQGDDKDTLRRVQGIFRPGERQPVVWDTLPYIRWDKPVFLREGLLMTETKSGKERFSFLQKGRLPAALEPYGPFSLSKDKSLISFYHADEDSIAIRRYKTEEWITHYKVGVADTIAPWLKDYREDAAERAREDSILKAARYTGPSFLEGVLTPKNAGERARQRKDSILRSLQYEQERITPYLLQLHSAYFSARVNNDFFINRYQPYLNYQGQFKFPEPGGMIRGGFTDLFENHHFSLAYRMPAGTEGSDFFVRYENTLRKTGWSALWFRKVESLQPDPQRNWKDENGNPYPNNTKVKTNYYELSIQHPLSYYFSIDLTTAIRQDRTIFTATEKYSLQFDDISSAWSLSTLSGTYNRLQATLPYLYKGFAGKIRMDFFKGFNQSEDALYGAGLDLQYHQPLYRYITGVLRFQAGTSGGSTKLLYNMGGVDNNLSVRADSTVHFAQDAPYAFQTLVTPLRGYVQNSLYGNQYALFNADVYFPLFESLIPLETPLSFINNFQPGLFADAAYARETWRHGDEVRSLWSYGVSARTTLAGYPLRFDIAWPGSFTKTPVWYLSLQM